MIESTLEKMTEKYGELVLSPVLINLTYCNWAKTIMIKKDWEGPTKKLNSVGSILLIDYEEKKYKVEDCKTVIVDYEKHND